MTTTTDTQLDALYTQAKARLNALNLPSDLLDDTSGQTSAEEHLTWLIQASDTDIRNWVQDLQK
jgi:hypothetical protein